MTDMRRHVFNAVGALVVLIASVSGPVVIAPPVSTGSLLGDISGDAESHVIDATGSAVPLRAWQRIASAEMSADLILFELVGAERLAMVSGAETDAALGMAGLPTVGWPPNVEAMLAAEVDLVIWPPGGGADAAVTRLRELGITVLVLPEQRLAAGIADRIRLLARVIGEPAAGRERAARFESRLAWIQSRVPLRAPSPRMLIMSSHAGRWYAGTAETSYASLMAVTGCRDVAAEAGLTGWPEVPLEILAEWDPDVIVVPEGHAARLREATRGLSLQALTRDGGVIELPGQLLAHPGVRLVDAAERLYGALWGWAGAVSLP